MTTNPESRKNDEPTSLNHLFRETYGLVDEAVASTTDEQIDDRLRTVLSRAGYVEEAAAEPGHLLPNTDDNVRHDDLRQPEYAEGELVHGQQRDIERAEQVFNLELVQRGRRLQQQPAHGRRSSAIPAARRQPVRRRTAHAGLRTGPATQSNFNEFIGGPWFPLVCVLAVVVVIVMVLVLTGSITGMAAVLAALTAVITGVGGLIAATRSFRR